MSLKKGLPFGSDSDALPWFTYPSIEFLDQLNFKGCDVFEYGSGNGTKYWAKHCHSVTSVESDLEWFTRNSQQTLPNQVVLYRQGLINYVNSLESGPAPYDVIIIDGSWRYDCVVKSILMIKKGGLIILDNSDWHPNSCKFLRDGGWTQIDFIGLGPINNYSWATSIFFKNYLAVPRRSNCDPIDAKASIKQLGETDQPGLKSS